ncbi:MAG: hypothetical protein MJY62_03745, partial [Bacteroidales bacterium]|nr:hypothetical protein [Bacteroidales bacterium]
GFGSFGKRYVNLAAHFSQYITPFKGGWLTIAYHLAYQGTVAGATPYYLLSYLYSPDALHCFSEGLGGDGTIRGMIRRRMVADGYAWGNLDLRLRFATIPIPGGFISMGADPFCDAGVIVQPHKIKEMASMQGVSEADAMRLARKVQVSVGCGLNLNVSNAAMISFSLAKSLTNRDTKLGLYLSAGYMF